MSSYAGEVMDAKPQLLIVKGSFSAMGGAERDILRNIPSIAKLFSIKVATLDSVTELELLSIVECLKEFKGMLWGQKLRVYTDHKNLVRDALGLTCDRVYRWRLLLEEYEPEIVYIKGVDNIVADAISRLEYDPDQKVKSLNAERKCHALVRLFTHYSQERD